MKILAKPISVIAKFFEDGSIIPVKFRIVDSNESIIEIKVEKILTIEDTKYGGVKSRIFNCQSEINGAMKRYELKYKANDYKWELFKM